MRDKNMPDLVIKLTDEEIMRITRISLDDDKEEALIFIKDTLEKKIKDLTRPHCVPVFEVTYNPRQKDKFSR